MTLTVERDGPVTTLIRSRVEARNAMDPASAEALTDALVAFDHDDTQSVAVLFGAGGAFCAGFDLKYAATLRDRDNSMTELGFPLSDSSPIPRGPMGRPGCSCPSRSLRRSRGPRSPAGWSSRCGATCA